MQFLLVLLIAFIGVAPANAGPVTHDELYRAEAVVTGIFEPERTRGMREALREVIIKLTGNAGLRTDQRVARLAANPAGFVDSYEYEDRMKDLPVHDEQGTRERPHFLRVRFNRSRLDAWLNSNGLAKWPPPRPRITVLLQVKTAIGTFLVRRKGARGYALRAVIMETSVRRGMPVWLPPAAQDGSVPAAVPAEAGPRLSGELRITASGYWDIDWIFESRRGAATQSQKAVTFDQAIRNGFELAAGILRQKQGAR